MHVILRGITCKLARAHCQQSKDLIPHPPLRAVSGHSDFMHFLYKVYMYMFMKQEKSEMDYLKKKHKKTLVQKEKYFNFNILRKYSESF